PTRPQSGQRGGPASAADSASFIGNSSVAKPQAACAGRRKPYTLHRPGPLPQEPLASRTPRALVTPEVPPVTPKEVLALIREKEVKAVDLRFMDFPGLWQHFTIPADELKEGTFEEGLGFDGSSIRGWQAINESDMLVMPVPETAFLDPFCKDMTLTMICNIQDP